MGGFEGDFGIANLQKSYAMTSRMTCEEQLETVCSLHDWASLRTELLFIYDQAVPPAGLRREGARVGELSAWLVRRGTVWLESDGEEARAGEGEWVICDGREIQQEISPGTELLSMRLLHGWPGGGPFFTGGTVHRLKAGRHPGLERYALALLNLVGRVPIRRSREDPRAEFLWKTRWTYGKYVQYERALLRWMQELVQCGEKEGWRIGVPEKADPRLAQVFRVIDSEPPGGAFPEREIVRLGGLSIGRLNRLCAQAYGFTTYGYWEQRRIERAKLALEQTGARVKEVAADMGFVQLSHFSAWFKRYAGVSPRGYRENYKPRS